MTELSPTWKDGEQKIWNKDGCPGCGNKQTFYHAVIEGERHGLPIDKVLFPLQTSMQFQAGIVHKQVTVLSDICTECGTIFAKVGIKQVLPMTLNYTGPNRAQRRHNGGGL